VVREGLQADSSNRAVTGMSPKILDIPATPPCTVDELLPCHSLFIYYLNLLSLVCILLSRVVVVCIKYAYYLPSSSIHSTGYEKETGRKVIIRHQSARLDLCSPGLLDSRNSDLSTEVDAEGIFAIYLIGRVTSRSAALPLASGLPNLRQESPG
jgi:hypothetical protein